MHMFGKTISVSMLAAALMFSSSRCNVLIYFTCKHMSTKLFCNLNMFLGIMYDVLQLQLHKVLGANSKQIATRATGTSRELFHHCPLVHLGRLVG